MDYVKQLFVSSRPVSWINTAYPFAAGYVFLTQSVSPILILGTLYFLIPYNILMYGVNDVFDYESDLRNPRKGGIEGAVLAKRFHRPILITAVLTNIPFLVALVVLGTPVAAAVLLAVVFFVVAYSAPVLRFKERPILDSITSAIHFVGPMVYAMVLVGWQPGFTPYVLAFLCWGMASHAFGAVQDVPSDRAAGLGSVATVLGARTTVWLAAGLYVAGAALLVAQGLPSAIVGWASLVYALNVAPYLAVTDATAERANRGWRRFIWLNLFTGFIVTMVLILSRFSFGP